MAQKDDRKLLSKATLEKDKTADVKQLSPDQIVNLFSQPKSFRRHYAIYFTSPVTADPEFFTYSWLGMPSSKPYSTPKFCGPTVRTG